MTTIEEIFGKSLAPAEPIQPLAVEDEEEELLSPIGVTIEDLFGGRTVDPRPGVSLGVKQSPVKAAKQQDIAKFTGYPRGLVQEAEAPLAEAMREQEVLRELRGLPTTTALFADAQRAAIAQDSVKELGNIERIGDAIERGWVSVRIGQAATKQRENPDQATAEKLEQLRQRSNELGQDGEGLVGWLGEAAEVGVGQMGARLLTPEAAQKVTFGATVGAGAGLAAGGIGALPGAAIGGAVGLTVHLATSAFVEEGGHSNIELLDAGVEPNLARNLSIGVGAINAGLEMIGSTAVLAPLAIAARQVFKKGVVDPVLKTVIRQAAANAAKAMALYTAAVTIEVGTEVSQEMVNIAAENLADYIQEEGVELLTHDENVERVLQIAEKTFKAMTILGLFGLTTNLVTDGRAAVRARRLEKDLLDLKEAVDTVPALGYAPDLVVEHTAKVLEDRDISEVFIPSDMIDELGVDPDALGVAEQMDEARVLGTDVRLTSNQFAQLLLADEYDLLKDHIRLGYGEMTAAEAKEFDEGGVQRLIDEVGIGEQEREIGAGQPPTEGLVVASIGADNRIYYGKPGQLHFSLGDFADEIRERAGSKKGDPTFLAEGFAGPDGVFLTRKEALALTDEKVKPTHPDMFKNKELDALDLREQVGTIDLAARLPTVAEQALGLKALFTTGKEAGMTDKQFEAYLKAGAESTDAIEVARAQRKIAVERRLNSAEMKEARVRLAEVAREAVDQRQVYTALNAIGVDRLDRRLVLEVLEGNKDLLKELPKSGRRQIYTAFNTQGLDPNLHAEQHGYLNAEEMLLGMIDAVPKAEAVTIETERLLHEQQQQLFDQAESLDRQVEALHNDKHQAVLMIELNAMRVAQKQKKLKPALVRAAAKEQLRKYKVGELDPVKFLAVQRREARKAGELFRKKDLVGAEKAKFRQILNYEMALEAFRVRERLTAQHKFLKRFMSRKPKVGNLDMSFLEAIQKQLSDVHLGGRLTVARRKVLVNWYNDARAQGLPVTKPTALVAADEKTNYRDLSLQDWETLYNNVRTMHKEGTSLGKMNKAVVSENREEEVKAFVEAIENNQVFRTDENETLLEKTFNGVRELGLYTLKADAILRQIDNFVDLGPVHSMIQGRYNDAMYFGYREDQEGFVPRWKVEAGLLADIHNMFPKKVQVNLDKPFYISGVKARMSHQRVLMVLLNSGNTDNLMAMLADTKLKLTPAELEIIHNHASKEDFDYMQAVFDFFDKFWPEIKAATERRRGFIPEKILAVPIETKFGTYRGGYYPIVHDPRQSQRMAGFRELNLEDLATKYRFGNFAVMHTRHGHTELRERGIKDGKPLLMDVFNTNAQVQQLLYDIHVGDATMDIFRLLHHPEVNKAFAAQGQLEKLRQLDLWFGDIVMGEMHSTAAIEKVARHLRLANTAVLLGYSMTTTVLQPLGLFNTMALLGKRNTFMALKTVMTNNPFKDDNLYKWIRSVDPMMAGRADNYNREISELSNSMSTSKVRKFTPGESLQHYNDMAFYTIKKLQLVADYITWLAGYRVGMEQFDMNEELAIRHASQSVERAQASGTFGLRTNVERGTLTDKTRQSEVIRLMNPFIGYFATKHNVQFEANAKAARRGALNPVKHPLKFANHIVDMMLLFTAEAILVEWYIRGDGPEPESPPQVVAGAAVRETLLAFGAGLPFLRSAFSVMDGFRGGGGVTISLDALKQARDQIAQGEADQAAFTAIFRGLGFLFKIPGVGQMIRTGEATEQKLSGEEIGIFEFFFGPQN